MTLDLYYKEGKGEVSSLCAEDGGYDYKRQVQFLDLSINWKDTELRTFNCTRRKNTTYSKYKINLIGLPLKLPVSRLTMKNSP
jgi:hypothetical protein